MSWERRRPGGAGWAGKFVTSRYKLGVPALTNTGQLLGTLLTLYSWILLARVVVSWLPSMDAQHPVVRFLFNATEPVLQPLRRLLPPMSGLDLSPIIAFVIISILRSFVQRL